MIRRIGVLTSGGDAPGMNAAVRSVVRTGIYEGLKVYGVYDGYLGLATNRIHRLDRHSVSDLLNRGGTFLGSSRFPEFRRAHVRAAAVRNVRRRMIDALVVIGGDGSYVGARKLNETGLSCVALPGTIDNDVAGTDYSIGHFTAVQTIVDAIDRLRDTFTSHQRISIVEVMGRRCGDLAMASAIAGGCEFAILPEVGLRLKDLVDEIRSGIAKGKKHAVIVVTENIYDVSDLARFVERQTGQETRCTVLGYLQRGGTPVAYDRLLASRMGVFSVELLLSGYSGKCVGIQNGRLVHHSIAETTRNTLRCFRRDVYGMARKLS